MVSDGPTVLARLVGQVTRPVRWDLCLDTMRDLGVTGTIELAPAGTLTGIARRELPGRAAGRRQDTGGSGIGAALLTRRAGLAGSHLIRRPAGRPTRYRDVLMNLQLTTPPRSAGSRVAGLGHYQPPTVVTNDDLVALGVNTNDEWVQSRVGIAERRFAMDETMLDMAVAAASKAMANSGISPTEVDLVILATCTGKQQVPGGAAELASRLGIPSPGAYDINAACAGFVYGLNAASNAVTRRATPAPSWWSARRS